MDGGFGGLQSREPQRRTRLSGSAAVLAVAHALLHHSQTVTWRNGFLKALVVVYSCSVRNLKLGTLSKMFLFVLSNIMYIVHLNIRLRCAFLSVKQVLKVMFYSLDNTFYHHHVQWWSSINSNGCWSPGPLFHLGDYGQIVSSENGSCSTCSLSVCVRMSANVCGST